MTHDPEQIADMPYVKSCYFCSGKGSFKQTYNAGCGMGYYSSIGPCSHCDATGLIYTPTGKSPPASVMRQIAVRALISKEKDNGI